MLNVNAGFICRFLAGFGRKQTVFSASAYIANYPADAGADGGSDKLLMLSCCAVTFSNSLDITCVLKVACIGIGDPYITVGISNIAVPSLKAKTCGDVST